jgi:tryptophan synthase alpha chain
VERSIERTFRLLKQQGKKAFIPFITAGDPDLDTMIRMVPEFERAGAHVVELGIPFSDPVADGPTIQRSSERALRHGYGMNDYLEAVSMIRKHTDIPLVLFSYFNPILQYGLDKTAREARACGIDGVLVTDITPEESLEYVSCLEKNDLDAIFLIAPTSGVERIRRIVGLCRGFVYVVSRTGVTGTRESLPEAIQPIVQRVRTHTQLPIAVGFGISTAEQMRAVWESADGAVVGSAIVAQMEKHAGSPDLVARIGSFCRSLIQPQDAPL